MWFFLFQWYFMLCTCNHRKCELVDNSWNERAGFIERYLSGNFKLCWKFQTGNVREDKHSWQRILWKHQHAKRFHVVWILHIPKFLNTRQYNPFMVQERKQDMNFVVSFVFPLSFQVRKCQFFPTLFLLHSELDGRLTPLRWCRSSSVEPFLRIQKVSSTYLFHSLGLISAVSSTSSSKNSM